MKRRQFLNLSAIATVMGLSGCQQLGDSGTTTDAGTNKVLNILPKVDKVSDRWLLEAMVINEYPQDASFHEIRLLAYTANGDKVCETEVGDLLKPTGDMATVKVNCPKFPAIITATAQESPCENALIPVDYWTGTNAQRTGTVATDEILWKDTYRKCGEALPPMRVVNKTNSTSK